MADERTEFEKVIDKVAKEIGCPRRIFTGATDPEVVAKHQALMAEEANQIEVKPDVVVDQIP